MELNGNLGGLVTNGLVTNRLATNQRAAAGSASGEPPVPTLLFALPHTARPSAALKSAAAIAASTHAELHVVSLLPRLGSLCARVDEPFDFERARRRIEECVAACRQTRAWCEDTLGEPLPLQRLRIRFGKPTEAIALRALELDARLVVLAPVAEPIGATALGATALGATAIGVARACCRPVLVARSFSAPGTVIAATDLQDDEYRVLRQATALGASLGTRVVAVHNVSCLSTPLGACSDAGARPAPELPRRMLSELPAPLDLVVTTELDPVGAILGQAQHHRSDIIVVGARSRAARRSGASVPSEVIDRSRCSVLVTSLES